MDAFIDHLHRRLQQPLPGQEAQFRLAHAARYTAAPPPPNARKASVLVLFFPKDEHWHLVLIERESSNPNDRHSGQVSFPGGQHDSGDPDYQYTALREAWEEVKAPMDQIQVLGALTELYIPVSNFLVYPYVGWLAEQPAFAPQLSEVRAILETPFASFQKPDSLRTTDIEIGQGLRLRDVPYFDIDGRIVWGATAMIISELLEVVGSNKSF